MLKELLQHADVLVDKCSKGTVRNSSLQTSRDVIQDLEHEALLIWWSESITILEVMASIYRLDSLTQLKYISYNNY
jgi:replicative DNA helicase